MAAGRHKAVIEIDAKVSKANKKIASLEKEVGKLERKLDKANKKTGKSKEAMGDLNKEIEGMVGRFAGPAGLIATAGLWLNKLDEMSAKAVKVNAVFGNMKVDIDKARQSTMGFVDDVTLASQANAAFALGAAKTSDEFAVLAEAGAKLAMSQGDDATHGVESLTTALARQSPLLLDNLGISLKVSEAQERYAAKLGKTTKKLTDAEKAEAFRVIAMEEALKRAKEVEISTSNNAAQWVKAKVAIENLNTALFTHADELEKVGKAETQGDLITAQLTASIKDQALRIVPLTTFFADHQKAVQEANDAQNGLSDVIRQATTLADQQQTTIEKLGSAFAGAADKIENMFNKAVDKATNKMMLAQIHFANMLLLVHKQQEDLGKAVEKAKKEREVAFLEAGGFVIEEDIFGNKTQGVGPAMPPELIETGKRGGGRGKKKEKQKTLEELINDASGPADPFTSKGAGGDVEAMFQEDEEAAMERELELLQAREASTAAIFDQEIAIAEFRGNAHEAEVLRLERTQALFDENEKRKEKWAKAEKKRMAELARKRREDAKAYGSLANSTADIIELAGTRSSASEEKVAKIAAFAKGLKAMATGAQVTAEGIADIASQNYPKGAAEIAAGIVNFAVGGSLIAGNIGGAAGAAGSGGAGGRPAGFSSPGTGTGASTNDRPGSNIPGSPSGSPPNGAQGGGQSGGGNHVTIHKVEVTGEIDDETTHKIIKGIERAGYTRGKISA